MGKEKKLLLINNLLKTLKRDVSELSNADINLCFDQVVQLYRLISPTNHNPNTKSGGNLDG